MSVGGRKIATGFGWQVLSAYSNRVFGIVTTLILAKVLTPQDFGLVAIASMTIEVLQIFKDMGLSEALIYSKRDDPEVMDTAQTLLVGFHTILFVIAAIISPFAARFYDNPMVMPVLLLMASNLVIDSLRAVPRTLVRRNIQFEKLVIPEVVPVGVSSLVSIVMALSGFGVWSLVAKTMLHSLLGLILLHRIIPYKPRFRWNRQAALDLMHYGKFVVGASMVFVVVYNVDRFYVSKFSTVAMLGMYEVANRLAELPVKQFAFMIGAVMFPVLTRMQRAGEPIGPVFLKTIRYAALVSVPLAIGLSVYGPTLIAAIYGERWAGMIPFLQTLSIYSMFRAQSSLIHDTFKASGHPRMVMRFAILKLVLLGGLGLPAITQYGVIGLCYVVIVTYAIGYLWELWTISHVLEVSFWSALGQFALLIAVSTVIILGSHVGLEWVIGRLNVWMTAIAIVAVALTYFGVMFVIDREVITDIRALARRPAA